MTQSLNKIPRHMMLMAWLIVLGAIAPMLDATMINIAISDLTHDFNATLKTIQWGITGYTLAIGIAVPIAGWLMNQFNSKWIYIYALIVFAVMSLCVALSGTVQLFILFRVFQGLSGGIISTLMMTLLVKVTDQSYLNRIIAIVTTPMILGPMLGPILGGMIVEYANWQWIFYINVYIMVVIVPILIYFLPNFEPFNKEKEFDKIGILLLTLICLSTMLCIIQATSQQSLINRVTIIFALITIILIWSYGYYNKVRNYQTILPTTLFKKRNFLSSTMGLFIANCAILGPMIIFPLFIANLNDYNTVGISIALIPQGLGMLIARPFIGILADKYGVKKILMISLICSIVSTIPFVVMSVNTPIIYFEVALFIRGLCVGGIMLPFTTNAYQGLEDHQLSEAGVGISMIENVGASFGAAILSTLVSSMSQLLQNQLQAFHVAFFVTFVLFLLLFIPTWMIEGVKENSNT